MRKKTVRAAEGKWEKRKSAVRKWEKESPRGKNLPLSSDSTFRMGKNMQVWGRRSVNRMEDRFADVKTSSPTLTSLRPRTDERRTKFFKRDESITSNIDYFGGWYRWQCSLSHRRSETPLHPVVYVATVIPLGRRWDNKHCQRKSDGKEGLEKMGLWCRTNAC